MVKYKFSCTNTERRDEGHM